MAKMVRFRVLDNVAIVTLDAPPVNALSAEVRGGLWEVFGRIEDNSDIEAVVLAAKGRMFSAGADIRDFERQQAQEDAPSLAHVCAKIEGLRVPVVVALQGQALGGGAELALAAHYRVAAPSARIGLPEVALGLIPSAGATQRLTRLIGAQRALEVIVSTSSLDASAAQAAGLIDGLVDGDLASGAVAFAKTRIGVEGGPRRASDIRKNISDGRVHQLAVSRARKTWGDSPLHAPMRAIDCVEAAALLPYETALAFEQDAFAQCLAHPQSVALRHIFVAERKIDDALIKRDGAQFLPVAPMGMAVVERLRGAWKAAAFSLVAQGREAEDIDGAMVAFGFRKGPFGGAEPAAEDHSIVRPLIAALLVEGAACVDQEAVQRISDIDALTVHGLGLSRRIGGPMRAAQTMGLIGLRTEMRVWAETSDLWAVPEIMDEAIKDSRGFDALG